MFKIGDKVICIEPNGDRLVEGVEYTIREVELKQDTGNEYDYVYVEGINSAYYASRFKLKENVRPLEIGDKVRVINTGGLYSYYDEFYNTHKSEKMYEFDEEVCVNVLEHGITGEIMNIAKHPNKDGILALVNCRNEECCFVININCLALMSDNPFFTDDYNIGDVIEFTKNGRQGVIYKILGNRMYTYYKDDIRDTSILKVDTSISKTGETTSSVPKIGQYIKVNGEISKIVDIDSDMDFLTRDVAIGKEKYTKGDVKFEIIRDMSKYKAEQLEKDLFMMFDNTEQEIEKYKDRITIATEKIKKAWKDIAILKKDLREYGQEMNLLQSLDLRELKANVKTQIEQILSIPHIKEVKPSEDWLIITTDRIDFYDLKGNKFEGNEYDIYLNVKTGDLKFIPINDPQLHVSYWDEDNAISPHPHVGTVKEYCLGNAGDMLCEYISERDIFSSILVVISFLEQCNEEDYAGKWVSEWTCIDEDGNEIENPHDSRKRCYECNITLDEDEMYICDRCGNVCCEDHREWIDNEDRCVCDKCRRDNYTYCDVCEKYKCDSDVQSCDECGKHVCDDCLYIAGDDTFCSEECRDAQYEYCNECNEYRPKDDMYVCEQCEKRVCYDCKIEEYDKSFCNHDCLNNWEEENMTTCDRCGERINIDDVYDVEDDMEFCSFGCIENYRDDKEKEANENDEE